MHDLHLTELGLISRQVMDAVPLGAVLIDMQGDIVWSNRGWATLCSHGHGAQSGDPPDSYRLHLSSILDVDPDDIERMLHGIGDVRNARRVSFDHECSIHSTGDRRWLSISATPVDDGDQRLMLVTHLDVTERKRQDTSVELYRAALEHAAEVVIITDEHGLIEYVNPAFTEVHGRTFDEAIGQPIWEPIDTERDQPLADAIMPALRAGKPWREERPVEVEDRALIWEERSIAPIRSEDGSLTHLVVIGRDVTDQRAYLDELKRHAYYDTLTGLPNRALFVDRLAHAHLRVRRSGQPLAVMYLDLNGFKSVNDRFGHGTGDQVLAEVAHRLAGSLRASDTVARTGGDEFIFLLEELATDDDAVTVARRLIDDISRPLQIEDSFISVSGGIGIAFNTAAISEPATLLDLSDIALYHAKAKLEDRVAVYREDMTMPDNDGNGRHGFPRTL